MFRRNLLGAMLIAAYALPAQSALGADSIPEAVTAAIKDPGRPPDDVVGDGERKPAQVVDFSQIKQGDLIAEMSPGGGYYTRILSKLVGPRGKVYAIVPHAGWKPLQSAEQKAAAAKAMGIRGEPRAPVETALAVADAYDYRNVTVMWESLDQFGAQFAVPQQLDAVWTSDNYHDYHNKNNGPLDMAAVDKAIFAALKPGGIFFIVDHAATKGAGFSVTETLHRVDPDAVKVEVTGAGFILDGQSNALANPTDDHTKNIRDPSIRGRTDQFIFRFKKPANAPATNKRPPDSTWASFYGNTNISGAGGRTERHVFYHPNGTYQEYGMPGVTPVQQGLWFWDTAGHNCMIAQFPREGRNTVVCHAHTLNHHLGETWTEDTYGTGLLRTHSLAQGYVLTPAAPRN